MVTRTAGTTGTTRLSGSSLLAEALRRREGLLERLHGEDTDCYRLFHGAVEGRPGLTVDRYGPVLLVQTWREGLQDGELEGFQQQVEASLGLPLTPVWNHRERGRKRRPFSAFHCVGSVDAVCREMGLEYDARPRHGGQDPLLFLDFRAARRRVLERSRGKTVLNLFAYTCGIGVCAAAGGATEVLNVDFSDKVLSIGQGNADRNGVGSAFETLCEDAIAVTRQLSGLGLRGRARRPDFKKLNEKKWDLVVLDPPRRSKGRFGVVDVVRDYPTVFKPALLCVAPGGAILATNNVASCDMGAWVCTLERCAAKAGVKLVDIEPLVPEPDWPSPDGRHPLKMVWIRI